MNSKKDVYINNGFYIPYSELEITASRAGGPGGQHVNKANTRISLRWNVLASHTLNEEQKTRILKNLSSNITEQGDLIIHSADSRSQVHNKQMALEQLKKIVARALYVPKKRIKTFTSKTAQEKRLQIKKQKSVTKKMRSKKIDFF